MREAGIGTRLASLFGIFGIDPRGLASLRIGLGAVLLIDLWMRTGRFKALYTDAGVFPRVFMDPWMRSTISPLHQLGGSLGWEIFLFGVAAVAALCLLLGWRTRIAAVVSWLLLVSLHSRQPLVLNFGDDILRMALFWGMFLPLGCRWSLDARRTPAGAPDAPVCSLATAAYLLQIAFVYFFTALLKNGPDWRVNGTALYYALSMDAWVTPLGVFLRDFPWLVSAVTWSTLVLEFVGSFLLFVPIWWLRTATVLAFLALHLGIAMSYRLGIFPWTDLVVLLPFLPPRVWDLLTRHRPASASAGGAVRRGTRGPLAGLQNAVIVLVFAYVLVYNIDSVRSLQLPTWLTDAGNFLRVNQRWRMFTPDAPRFDGWFVIPGHLADGSTVDLSVHGPELTWQKPPNISADRKPFRWAIYMWQINDPYTNHLLRKRFVDWSCHEWNASHPPERRLERIEVHFLHEETLPPGEGVRLEPRLLIDYDCSGSVRSWGIGSKPPVGGEATQRISPGA